MRVPWQPDPFPRECALPYPEIHALLPAYQYTGGGMRWLTVTPHTSGGIDSYETARRIRLLEEEKRKKT